MGVKLTSYLNFNGDAAEALAFYHSVFGGSVDSDTFGEFADRVPDSGMPVADEDRDKIMHATLRSDNGIELMLSDVPTGMEAVQKGNDIVLALSGEDEAIIRGYWDKLSDGGQVTMPLEKAPWGDTFGALVDKFGTNWMVDIGPEQPQA